MRRLAAAALSLALLLALLGAIKLVAGSQPSSDEVETQTFTLHSKLLDRDLEQILFVPDAAPPTRRNLLVLLHGRSDGFDGPESMLSDELFSALEDLGASAPAVLLVNGGKSSYFHDRRDGPWVGTS